MTVVVTRPADQASHWVARLAARGIDAVALPLIEIGPAPDPVAVRAAWAALPDAALVVFVSPNAVQQFFAQRGSAQGWPAGVRAGSTGAGTSRALHAAGVPSAQLVEPPADAPQFDSEALWGLLCSEAWSGRRVIVVRGDGGREWLADTLRANGAQVQLVSAYRRSASRFDASQQALLQAALIAPRAHLWFFSSSEAIDHLAALVGPGADWSEARAIATHPRIAARAQQLGLAEVVETGPALAAVRACIQSMPP